MEETQEKQKIFGVIPVIRPDSKRTLPIIVGSVVIVLVIVIIISIKAFLENMQPRISLLYTPISAVVTVDGRLARSGEIALSAGTHEVKAEKYGFETETRMVEVEPGGATPVYIVMTPVMEETENWHTTHEEDGRIVEGISGYQYDAESESIMSQNPIVNKLPVVTNTFGIYQQGCDESTLCIYIDTYEGYYNTAIEYFRNNLDSDLGKYSFVFRNYSNPFLGEG